jgi:glycosyltransferase involved in cell wall biosynthesis
MNELICAVCPTCNRPELLGRSIKCFERQTYKNRHLIIVDDLGQYKNQKGENWELISLPTRINTLGEKRNFIASLAPKDTWAFAVWDDDDFYMPWHLEALAFSLLQNCFVQPKIAIDFWNGKWVKVETYKRKLKKSRQPKRSIKVEPTLYCYHGCWGYTKELFIKVGGYKHISNGDDGEFQKCAIEQGIISIDTDPKYKPSYFYNRIFTNRISELGDVEYDKKNKEAVSYIGIVPKWTDESEWDRTIPDEQIERPW